MYKRPRSKGMPVNWNWLSAKMIVLVRIEKPEHYRPEKHKFRHGWAYRFVSDGIFPDADARIRKRKTCSSGCILYGDIIGGPCTSLPTQRTTRSTGTVQNFHHFRRATQKNQNRPAACRNRSLTPHMRATQTRLKLLPN